MTRVVRVRCPLCGCRLGRDLPAYTYATDVRDRKCRGCGVQWRLTVEPVAHPDGDRPVKAVALRGTGLQLVTRLTRGVVIRKGDPS